MISSAPLIAASDMTTLAQKVKAFIVLARVKAADGLTVAEFGELLVAMLRVAMDAAESIPADGEAKKAWVLEAVGLLFDDLADQCVPLLAWPVWVVIRPLVRQLVLAAAGGAIESLLPLVRIASK
jgi:hypothetical protein